VEKITMQTGNIQAGGYGYSSLNGSDGVVKLGERHLVIERKGAFLLDVHFDPDKAVWRGVWTPCGGDLEVMLKRPVPDPPITPNPLVGDWQGMPGKNSDSFPLPLPEASSLIHIREDGVGRMFGWAEWSERLDSERDVHFYGEGIAFSSFTPDAVRFEPSSSAECQSCSASTRFEGALSQDKKEILGKWSYYRTGALVRDTTTTYQRIQ